MIVRHLLGIVHILIMQIAINGKRIVKNVQKEKVILKAYL